MRNSWIILFLLQVPMLQAQNRPMLELSIPISPTFVPNIDIAVMPSVNITLNYNFTPRISAGINGSYQDLVTKHLLLESLNSPDNSYDERYFYREDYLIHSHTVVSMGVNAKYNLINRHRFRLFTAGQINYVKISAGKIYNNDQVYYNYLDSANFQTVQLAVPYLNKSGVAMNMSFGFDRKLFRNAWLYGAVEYQDVFHQLPFYYNVHFAHVSLNDGTTNTRINKATIVEQGPAFTTHIWTLQLGLRFYLLDKKR